MRKPRVYVAGHKGMVGSAILRKLKKKGDFELITREHRELDLTDQAAVRRFMEIERPHLVILAAAKVGGIQANNSYPAEFIYDNLLIAANVIHQAYSAGVTKLLQLGSSCIYPKSAPQPMGEKDLLTGPLEPTNEPYAVAKIAGIKLCESYNRQYGTDYRSVMPTNLYGPHDNFDLETSHVLPALIRKFHDAKTRALGSVTIWGTGTARREFLHVDDMAEAALFILDLTAEQYAENTEPMLSHINVGSGQDLTILELARLVADAAHYTGEILTDPSKPDGTPRKLLDGSRMQRMGWRPHVSLEQGVRATYRWFVENEYAKG